MSGAWETHEYTWWYIRPDRPAYPVTGNLDRHLKEKFGGSGHGLDVRGGFTSEAEAEEHRWRDSLPSYWAHGLPVWADHCVGCGLYAKVLAFDNVAGGWAWRVTECVRCGVLDSRIPKNKEASHGND